MKSALNIKNNINYYNMLKWQLLPLIQEGPNVILDLGCGAGQFGRALQDMKKVSEIIGVEIHPQAAEEAAKYYTKVYQDNVESLSLPYEQYFDYVICGDILEHLVDPWAMLLKINRMLKQGGSLICSIPNIRYWKIITELTLKGKWEYTDAGILDSTHLRFFTKYSFIEMLNFAGYSVTWVWMSIHGKKAVVNKITFELFSEFLATQIMFSANKI